MNATSSTVIIQGAGVEKFESDDIAMIFFLTIENSFDHKIQASLYNIKCAESDPYGETTGHMTLIGGDMGYVHKKSTKNLTLIYPNLYLQNRAGTCMVALNYRSEGVVNEIRHEIHFHTPGAENHKYFQRCPTHDLDDTQDCIPVDCQIKYSSKRSFFSKEYKICQFVPECLPNTVYNPKSNTCRKLHTPVCKSELEMLEDGHSERCHGINNLVTFTCHRGSVDNYTGYCVCEDGWSTSSCGEDAYHPSLGIYHMCNIGLNTWERANKEKLAMTIIAVVIFALAVAAKMLIAVCLLNWCCHFMRSKKDGSCSFCELDNCSNLDVYCGSETCQGGKLVKSSRNVSFTETEGFNSDATISLTSTDTETDRESGTSAKGSCQCSHRK